jgi:nitric oxide reductase NorQ protein
VLPIDRTGELLHAPDPFMLVVSYNPGYQNFLKGMKPSTRQRFVSMRFDFPVAAREEAILIGETACEPMVATQLVSIGRSLRALKDVDLEEVASTRLLVYAALLIRDGLDPVEACRAALVESLTDDIEVAAALMEVVLATFGR